MFKECFDADIPVANKPAFSIKKVVEGTVLAADGTTVANVRSSWVAAVVVALLE